MRDGKSLPLPHLESFFCCISGRDLETAALVQHSSSLHTSSYPHSLFPFPVQEAGRWVARMEADIPWQSAVVVLTSDDFTNGSLQGLDQATFGLEILVRFFCTLWCILCLSYGCLAVSPWGSLPLYCAALEDAGTSRCRICYKTPIEPQSIQRWETGGAPEASSFCSP